ncbi:metallophosphoesterase [Candidatus Alkanophaga liquidiphilum]|nr:DNA repair exonuclease SbcCD nuclease subunit [Candidatus Alkanophaga liquidiphilum]RLG37315.1 MAG: DNA repair exonuclease [Candidatus Alkanophagales archaeon]
MRLAHISDTHLGFRQYNLEEREQDFYDAFAEAVERALEERVAAFIHAGDLFDTPQPPIRALHVFKNCIRRIRDAGVRFYAVLGDHDTPKRRGMPPHTLFDIHILGTNGTLQHTILRESGEEVLLAGISNLKGRRVQNLNEELRKFDRLASGYENAVLVAHQAVKRFLPFEGAYELEDESLPKLATYYAFGHIHARTTLNFGRGLFAYAGSTEITSRDEIPVWEERGKGFFIVDVERGGVDVHSINLDIRPQVNVNVRADALEEVLKVLAAHRKKPVLHVLVETERENKTFIVERLKKLVSGKVLYLRPLFVTKNVQERVIKVKESDKEDMIKQFLSTLLKDETLVQLSMELYMRLSENDINAALAEADESFKSMLSRKQLINP